MYALSSFLLTSFLGCFPASVSVSSLTLPELQHVVVCQEVVQACKATTSYPKVGLLSRSTNWDSSATTSRRGFGRLESGKTHAGVRCSFPAMWHLSLDVFIVVCFSAARFWSHFLLALCWSFSYLCGFFLRSKAERKSLLFCQWKGVLWRRLPGKHPVDPCNETCQCCQQTHSLSACQLYLCVTHFWSSILPGPSAPAFSLAQPQPWWLPICGAGGRGVRGLGFVAQTSSWSHNLLWWLLLRRQEWDEQQQKNEWVNFLFHLMDILMDSFLLPSMHSLWVDLSMKQLHSPLLGWCR